LTWSKPVDGHGLFVGFIYNNDFEFIAFLDSFRQSDVNGISKILVEIVMEFECSFSLLSIFLEQDLSDIDSNNIKNNVIGGLDDFKCNSVVSNKLLFIEINLEGE